MKAHGPMHMSQHKLGFSETKSERLNDLISESIELLSSSRPLSAAGFTNNFPGSKRNAYNPLQRSTLQTTRLQGGFQTHRSSDSLPIANLPMTTTEEQSINLMTIRRRLQIAELRQIQANEAVCRDLNKYASEVFNYTLNRSKTLDPPSLISEMTDISFERELSTLSSKSSISPYVLHMSKTPESLVMKKHMLHPRSMEYNSSSNRTSSNYKSDDVNTDQMSQLSSTRSNYAKQDKINRREMMNQIRLKQKKIPVRFYHDRVARELVSEGDLVTKKVIVPTRWPDVFTWDIFPKPQLNELAARIAERQTLWEINEQKEKDERRRRMQEKEKAIVEESILEEEQLQEEEQNDAVEEEGVGELTLEIEEQQPHENTDLKNHRVQTKKSNVKHNAQELKPILQESTTISRASSTVSSVSESIKYKVKKQKQSIKALIHQLKVEKQQRLQGVLYESLPPVPPLSEPTPSEPSAPGQTASVSEGAPVSGSEIVIPQDVVNTSATPVEGDNIPTLNSEEPVLNGENAMHHGSLSDESIDLGPPLPDIICPANENKSRQHEVRLWLRGISYVNLSGDSGVCIL